MRSHNDAARMASERLHAARPAGEPFIPNQVTRAMIGDLVPFEELDSVVLSTSASVQMLAMRLIENGWVDQDELDAEQLQSMCGAIHTQIALELAYAFLMAEADKALKAPAAAEMAMCVLCLTRIENVPGSGRCARCHRPVHGGRA